MTSAKEKITGLNTLRFLAFFSIFLFHSASFFRYGYLGVDFFFVLSSFLLTYLALGEIGSTNTFSKGKFFVRRVLRIFPLYFMIVILLIFLLPLLGNALGWSLQMPQKPQYYFLFLSNLEHSDHLFALKFLWSIAVEEQFYVLFLILSLFFRKHFWIPILFLLTSYLTYMLLANQEHWDTYTNLVPHFSNFAVGMVLAWICHRQKNSSLQFLIAGIISALLSAICYRFDLLFPIFFSVSMASIIYLSMYAFEKYALHEKKYFRMSEFLGTYTYGLYVYSGIVLSLSKNLLAEKNVYLVFVFNFLVVIILAMASYHLYEKWFIRLKARFYAETTPTLIV